MRVDKYSNGKEGEQGVSGVLVCAPSLYRKNLTNMCKLKLLLMALLISCCLLLES